MKMILPPDLASPATSALITTHTRHNSRIIWTPSSSLNSSIASFSVPLVLGRPFDSPMVTFIRLAVRPDSEGNCGIQEVSASAGGWMGLVGAERVEGMDMWLLGGEVVRR